MTKAKMIPDEGHYQRAAWYLEQPKPTRNWFDQGSCNGAPIADFPEEKTGAKTQEKQALKFIPQYCGNCAVKTECAVDMIQRGGIPLGNVHGGLLPADATCIAKAAQEIKSKGGVEQAGPALGFDLTPIAPSYAAAQTPLAPRPATQ